MRRGTILHDVPEALRKQEVWAIARDRDGSLWFGTRGGLVRLSSRGVEVDRSERDGLSSNYVDALYEDREGTLWVGTQLDGVNQICGGPITTWSSTEGLGGNAVWTIVGDSKGKTYVGTEGGGIFVIENGRAVALQPAEGLSSKTIISLAYARDGTLWAGSYDRGLFSLRNGKWTSISKTDGLPSDMINTIEPNGATLWVGTALGLCRIDGRRITTFRTTDGLPSDFIDAIHRDRLGRLWAATENGISVFDGARFTSRIGSQLLPQQASYSLYEDAAGGIWAGMHRGLLHVTPSGRIRILTSRDGLAQDEIRSIQQDRAGDFWLTCSKGIFRVSRRDLERGRINSILLGPGDGMKHGECTYGSSPTSWAAPDGSIWFATSRGAARLDPTLVSRGAPPQPVLIERLLVDGKPTPIDQSLDLEPGTEKLEFHFTSPSFAAPKQIQFNYRLDGYDDNWIEAGNDRVAHYTHIPPGSYRFRVSAHVASSATAEEARLPIVLRPAFQRTGWFRSLVVAVVLLIAAVLYLRRVRRIRSQYNAVIAERNRIAREFHDTIAQMLVGIGFHLDAAIDGLHDDPRLKAIEEELGRARKLARQSLSDTRRALLDMRPDVLERGDLAAAVIAVGDETKKASAIDVRVEIMGEPRRLNARVEQHILRIAQEGVTNAVRHSGAQKIRVELCFGIEEVGLVISDNGSGPHSLADSGPLRLGFLGIRERAAEIGGRLSVTSRPGEGMTVMLTVPVGDRRPTLATRILAWSGRR
jgi:signal transduction histidine kinase/streptogramin lyase